MQPFDYTLNVATPFQATLQGYEGGLAIRDAQAKQALQEQAILQAEQQRQAQLQMQRDLFALSTKQNATGADYASIMARYPQLSEHFKRGWDVLNQDQQQNKLSQATQVYAALHSGNPQVAAQVLREQAAALRNSGQEREAKAAETMATWAEKDPVSAKTTAGLMLSSLMGPDKFAETFSKLGAEQRAAEQAPIELRKKTADAAAAESEATTKSVTAKYAERATLAELEKKGWDVKAIQADIDYKRQDSRIKAMNAAISREGNDLKRQELQIKVKEAQQKLDDSARTKVAEVESAAFAMDNMLNTIERVKKNPRLNAVVGTWEGRMPAVTSDESADAIAMIETLGSQAFLSQIPNVKGMGNLSNAEGDKLQASLQNLSRVQSEKQFRANLDEASRLIKKARDGVQKRYGVAVTAPDTPAAPGARPPLASFNR